MEILLFSIFSPTFINAIKRPSGLSRDGKTEAAKKLYAKHRAANALLKDDSSLSREEADRLAGLDPTIQSEKKASTTRHWDLLQQNPEMLDEWQRLQKVWIPFVVCPAFYLLHFFVLYKFTLITGRLRAFSF